MKQEPLTIDSLQKNLRVEYRPAHGQPRKGLLTGQRINHNKTALVEAFPEGSSTVRIETWEISRVYPLPREQQLPGLGGKFQPPRGYPFMNSSAKH